MLRELALSNLAVIEKTRLEFDDGFTVLTGETGAGKSLLVGALNLILGARASADLIRTGAEEATVEAAFEGGDAPQVAELLESAGIPVESTLIVRRTISKSGRNKIYLNGALAPLATLSAVSELLLGIMGQHEHHDLLRPEVQRGLLDLYADHEPLLYKMKSAYEACEEAACALSELEGDESERAKRLDYLTYLCQELDEAALKDDEEQSLETDRERLASAEKILAAAGRGADALYDSEGAACEVLGRLRDDLADLAGLDSDLDAAAGLVGEALPQLEEAARLLGRAGERLGEDAGSVEKCLNEIEGRLDLLTKLKRKHGVQDVPELLARYEALMKERAALEQYDSQLEKRRKALEETEKKAQEAAAVLSKSRAKAAKRLAEEVSGELSDLAMESATLEVKLEKSPTLAAHGSDKVEFLFAPNPGETPRPLARIASGGELSRVLLALRLVLTEPGRVRTLVLDEVDAGIGGVTAQVVGEKIRRLAGHFQVVCVTHLPQIACQAQRHLHIRKDLEAGRTHTRVAALSQDERVEEISRMLGGSAVTEKVRATARELLGHARAAG